MMMMVMITDKD